tara:strand:+ start:68 stop:634 length:567 start_codon:yes stop_codon:yes gene_type:complete
MKDFIYCKKNVLSEEVCDYIISIFNENPHTWEEGRMEEGVNHEKKKCTEIYLNSEQKNPFNLLFLDELRDVIVQYIKEYPFVDQIDKWEFSNVYKIQKYLPNEGYFEIHCENSHHTTSPIDNRVLVWMIYLNDVTDGGYTEFPQQNRLIQPGVGDILIWPPYWTHPHKGITSKTQTKYIMTGWFNYSK